MNAVVEVDDEMLLAYLEAQLDDADYPRVEAALATSVPLQKRLQALVDSGEQLRRAFHAKLEEPVPASLIAAIMAAPDPRLTPPVQKQSGARRVRVQTNWWGKARQLVSWVQAPAAWPATALASVATLALGVWLGQSLQTQTGDQGGHLARGQAVPQSALAVALELAPSGRMLKAPDHQMQILVSLVTPAGQVCREFETAQRQQSATTTQAGVACRHDSGAWSVTFLVSDTVPNQTGVALYRSASDGLHQAIDDYLLAMPGLQAIPAAREQALLSAGWAVGAESRR